MCVISRLRLPMGKYSIEKGRRKAVGEFTNRQGLTMLGIVGTSWHYCSGRTITMDLWISASRRRLGSSLALYARTGRSLVAVVMVGRKESKFGVKARMRRITNSLAVSLSLLIVANSVSASSCDLACWLRRAHFDCHSVGSAATVKKTGMSRDMDMGSGHGGSVMAPDANMNPMPGHSMSSDMGLGHSQSLSTPQGRLNARPDRAMSMSPQMEMAPEQFVTPPQPETRRADHSTPLSPCTHELCSQVSASTSPPSGSQSQYNSLHSTATISLSPLNLGTSFRWIKLGIPPPKLLATDCLTTILRI